MSAMDNVEQVVDQLSSMSLQWHVCNLGVGKKPLYNDL